jgi:hypothetical protein
MCSEVAVAQQYVSSTETPVPRLRKNLNAWILLLHKQCVSKVGKLKSHYCGKDGSDNGTGGPPCYQKSDIQICAHNGCTIQVAEGKFQHHSFMRI